MQDHLTGVLRPGLPERAYEDGELLLRQGEQGTFMMYILEGQVEVTVRLQIPRDGSNNARYSLFFVSKGKDTRGICVLSSQKTYSLPLFPSQLCKVKVTVCLHSCEHGGSSARHNHFAGKVGHLDVHNCIQAMQMPGRLIRAKHVE